MCFPVPPWKLVSCQQAMELREDTHDLPKQVTYLKGEEDGLCTVRHLSNSYYFKEYLESTF